VSGARVFGVGSAALLLLLVAMVGSGAAKTTKVPAPLVGAWARTITAAEWQANGITSEQPTHTSMLVSADGSVVAGESTDVRIAPLSGKRVVISHAYGCGNKKGVYHWQVAAGRLTLTKLQSSCGYMNAVYAGVWKREKA
jgi:hypothetical protein